MDNLACLTVCFISTSSNQLMKVFTYCQITDLPVIYTVAPVSLGEGRYLERSVGGSEKDTHLL